MLEKLINFIFGCGHYRTTFPRSNENGKDPVVICLDCGKEFAYDWATMSRGEEQPATAAKWKDDVAVARERLRAAESARKAIKPL